MFIRLNGPSPQNTSATESDSPLTELEDTISERSAKPYTGSPQRRKRIILKASNQRQRVSKKQVASSRDKPVENDDELVRDTSKPKKRNGVIEPARQTTVYRGPSKEAPKRKKRADVTKSSHHRPVPPIQEPSSDINAIEYDEPSLGTPSGRNSPKSPEFSTDDLAYVDYDEPDAQPSKRRKSVPVLTSIRAQALYKKEELSSDDDIFKDGKKTFLHQSKLRKSTLAAKRPSVRTIGKKSSPNSSSSEYRDDAFGQPSKRRETAPFTRSLLSKLPTKRHDSSDWGQTRPRTSTLSVTITPKVPQWHTLPYKILQDIFFYASHPIQDDFFEPNDSIHWLVSTALLCRAFSEPALSALYYCPPLYPDWRAKDFISKLSQQDQTSTINYRTKVKYLDVLATNVLLQKLKGPDSASLENLIRLIPQVRGIAIHLLSDRPQSRVHMVDERSKVKVYRNSLFDALSENMVSLRSWKWNFRFDQSANPEETHPWSTIRDIHLQMPFQGLRELVISRYDSRSNIKEPKLAEALCALPELRTLSLDSCTSSPEKLLPLLPTGLGSLTISSMPDLTSDILLEYLLTHGSNLRELMLNHNQSLDIGFLVDLAYACPVLEVLSMDMAFYSCFGALESSEPKYRTLLPDGIVPTWPTTLQSIELLYLRKWDSDRAKVFLESLEKSSENLRHLRRLTLKTSIEIAWRDRAEFRDEWIGKLRKAFLRCSHQPGNLVINGRSADSGLEYPTSTIIDFPARQQGRRNRSHGEFSHVEIPSHRRQSKRLGNTSEDSSQASNQLGAGSDSDGAGLFAPYENDDLEGGFSALNSDSSNIIYQIEEVSDSDAPVIGQPRARRSSRSDYWDDGDTQSSLSDVDETILIEGSGLVEVNHFTIPVPPRKPGTCDLVDIRIDNLRPAPMQFNEDDFLDPELSGDEDWDGDDNLTDFNA